MQLLYLRSHRASLAQISPYRSIAWEQIPDVWRAEVRVNGIRTQREVAIKVGRDRAIFTEILRNWKQLAECIQEYTYPHLWAEAVAEFNAGNKVRFGKELAVSRDVITIGGKSISWQNVKKMMVRNGTLVVFDGKRGENHAFLPETPNIHVLLNLLEYCPVKPS